MNGLYYYFSSLVFIFLEHPLLSLVIQTQSYGKAATYLKELERWLRGEKHFLFWQRAPGTKPSMHTQWIITAYNP